LYTHPKSFFSPGLVEVDDGDHDAEGHSQRAGAGNGTLIGGGGGGGLRRFSLGFGRGRRRLRGGGSGGLSSEGGMLLSGSAGDSLGTRGGTGGGRRAGLGGLSSRSRGSGLNRPSDSRAGTAADGEHGGVIARRGVGALADFDGVLVATRDILWYREGAGTGVSAGRAEIDRLAEVVRVAAAEVDGDCGTLRIGPVDRVLIAGLDAGGGDTKVGDHVRIPLGARVRGGSGGLGDRDGSERSGDEEDVREMHLGFVMWN